MNPLKQKNNCLLLASHLESNVSDTAFIHDWGNVRRAVILYHAASLNLCPLSLDWIVPPHMIPSHRDTSRDQAVFVSVFGPGIDLEAFRHYNRRDTIAALRNHAETLQIAPTA